MTMSSLFMGREENERNKLLTVGRRCVGQRIYECESKKDTGGRELEVV